MNTKNYLQIHIRERAKQSWGEEQKYPKRLHKTESVGQRARRPYPPTGAIDLIMMMMADKLNGISK